jgi:hypothetical protein
MFESSHKKLNKKFNWAGNIRDILCRYGFNHIWISQDVVYEDKFACEFKQRVFVFCSDMCMYTIFTNQRFIHIIHRSA